MLVPTFEEFLNRQDIQILITELEDAYELLDAHNGIKVHMNMVQFIDEYLEAEYDSEISDYYSRAYDEYKDERINNGC